MNALSLFVMGGLTGASVTVLAGIAWPTERPVWAHSRRGRENTARHRIGEHRASEIPAVPRWWTPDELERHAAREFILALTALFATAQAPVERGEAA